MTTAPWRVLYRALFLLATGSFTFGVASGCEPEVRAVVLGGLNELAVTLVDAVFIGIAAGGQTAI